MIELLWNAPVSEEKMAKVIETMDLRENQKVLDFGCGNGEVLIRLAERYRINGKGVDSSEIHIAEANRRANGRTSDSRIEFVLADVQSYPVEPNSLDLAICMGATHAFGLGTNAYQNALVQMVPMVRTGGFLLVAEGYAKQPVPSAYKEFIGDSLPDEMTHAANVATGQELGLVPFAAWTSTEEEWDDFEWTYQRVIEKRAETEPNNENTAKLVQRRDWMDGYLKWGRDTLGYGTYLFKKPDLVQHAG